MQMKFQALLAGLIFAATTLKGQILPDKYYRHSAIQTAKVDSCIIYKIGRDSSKKVDLRIAYDRKNDRMTFLDQLNGSRVVFKYNNDSFLAVQEFYIKDKSKEEKAGMDSFFYDANGKKTYYHSIIKSKKDDVSISIRYFYHGDTLFKEEYYLNSKVFKTVYHTYDKRSSTEIVTTVSTKEANKNEFYKRDAYGNVIKYFSIDSHGDTDVVHLYKYDNKGRQIQAVTYDSRSNVSNIYQTTYYPNGLVKTEVEYLNILFGDKSNAIYIRKAYRYVYGK